MLTFTTFALLATLLFVTLVAIQAMRRERKELQYSSHLLDSVIELEKELTTSYEVQSDLQADIAELHQELQAMHHSVSCLKLMHETELNRADALADELLRTKESSSEYVQSLQEEIDQLHWDIKTYADVCNPNSEIEEELVIARQCIWDKSQELSKSQELLNEVAEDLLSLGFKDGGVKSEDLFKIHDLIKGNEIPF